MKIGEALQEVKELQSRLVRLQRLQAELFNYIEGTQPAKTFNDYDEEINAIHDKIIELKIKIQQANLSNTITVQMDGGEQVRCTIAEAILQVGRLRSRLFEISNLTPRIPEFAYGKEEIVSYYMPLTSEQKAAMITELETRKRKYDLAIQGANWTFDV